MKPEPRKGILIVEDSEDEVAITLRALERSGLDVPVVVLEDGAEALAYLRSICQDSGPEAAPAAIFLDLRMPRVDGKQVLREARANPVTANVPIIVVSSTQHEAEIQDCYRLGANSFISKRYGETPPGRFMVEALHYWLELNTAPAPRDVDR